MKNDIEYYDFEACIDEDAISAASDEELDELLDLFAAAERGGDN